MRIGYEGVAVYPARDLTGNFLEANFVLETASKIS